MTAARALVFVAASVAAGCDGPASSAVVPGVAPPPNVETRPAEQPAAPRVEHAFPTFVDVTKESGLAACKLHAGSATQPNWVLEVIGGGAIVLDYDGDGKMDVVLVDGDGVGADGEIVHEPDARTRLWHNDGNLRFTDVTAKAGVDVVGYGLGGAAADYDGDGHADFVVVGYDMLRLLRNQGDGTFREVAKESGLVANTWDTTNCCAWGDLDGDGRLDLFTTGYADQRAKVLDIREKKKSPRSCAWRGHTTYCGPTGLVHGKNHVYFQRPDHSFEDRTATNLVCTPSYSFQAVLSDFDADGDLDAYVANDGEANYLLVNDGKGRLVDRAVEAGCAGDADFNVQGTMGVDVADYDHDGRPDVFVTNFAHEHNVLYHNGTTRPDRPLFDDATVRTHVSVVPQGRVCWGTKLVDFDDDGDLDVFDSAGHVYPEEEVDTRGRIGNKEKLQVLRGLGGPAFQFEDVSACAGAPFEDARLWRGAAFADFDDDGDWDVLVTALRDAPALLRNDGGNRLNWIRLDLRGRGGLATPAGARVVVHLDERRAIYDELHVGSSYACSNDPRLLIGVGDCVRLPLVEIRWPDGAKSELRDVPTRQTVLVREAAR